MIFLLESFFFNSATSSVIAAVLVLIIILNLGNSTTWSQLADNSLQGLTRVLQFYSLDLSINFVDGVITVVTASI